MRKGVAPPLRLNGALLAVLLALLALPALGTIWTRSSNVLRIARGSRIPIPNATYVTREWNVAVTGLQVTEGPATGDLVSPKWLFYYRNTDSEVHYVAITVQCQDTARRDRSRFAYTATLEPSKEENTVEILSKIRAEDWRATQYAKVTIDFLSTPSG